MPINKHRILYIGPYREFSGAGQSARNYIRALYHAGHDICIAPIFTTGDIYPENEISSEILPLENNYLKKYDILIQHCHPFDYIQDSRFDLNIGLFQFNTQNLHKILRSRFNLVDRIIVNSKLNHRVLNDIVLNSDTKVKYVPELIDLSLKDNSYQKYDWLQKKDPYVFYGIGDFIHRKNFISLISAYIHTFRKDDNVQLIVKTKPHHLHNNHEILCKEIDYEVSRIYDANKISKESAPDIKMMIGKFEYYQLLKLHYNGNCFVDVSMGENFGYSVLESALFNNDIIVNKHIGSSEIVGSSYTVNANICNVYDPYTKSFIDNTIDHKWMSVDYEDLCYKMKLAWLNRYNTNNQYDLDQFSYSRVNELIC
jgi:glycosyltransferase involved in cell wall biosynthesis